MSAPSTQPTPPPERKPLMEDPDLRLIDADGQILAEGDGPVTAVSFKDKRNKHDIVESTERAHTVKVVNRS